MAEKNGNIPWSKFGMAAGALVVGLIVYIWQTSVPPAAIPMFEKIGQTDSVQTARLTWLENQRAQDSIRANSQTALLIEMTQLLKDRLPQVGPHR